MLRLTFFTLNFPTALTALALNIQKTKSDINSEITKQENPKMNRISVYQFNEKIIKRF